MLKYVRVALLIIIGIAFVWVFEWAYRIPSLSSGVDQTATIEGRYANYKYTVEQISDSSLRTAAFDPSLKADDAVVMGALQEIMHSVYGDDTAVVDVPAVETINERNYITFSAGNAKTYFELFKNDKGMVGSVSFWRQAIK